SRRNRVARNEDAADLRSAAVALHMETRGLSLPERGIEAAAATERYRAVGRDGRDVEAHLIHVRDERHGVAVGADREDEIPGAVGRGARLCPGGEGGEDLLAHWR